MHTYHTYRFLYTVDNDPFIYHSDITASNRKEAGKIWKDVKAMIPFSRRRVHIVKVITLTHEHSCD